MAVGAEESQVLKSVVVVDAVDVIEMKDQSPATPFGEAAPATLILPTASEQAPDQ